MAMRGCGDVVSVSRIARLAALLLAALCLICSARADSGIESWSALQNAIDSAASGDTIVLTGDLTAGARRIRRWSFRTDWKSRST